MAYDTSQLYSTVRNLMGMDHSFAYIPPFGRRLKAGQAYTVPGDIITRITIGGSRKGWNQQRFRSFERDLLLGRLALERTPPPFFVDGNPLAAVANPTTAITVATTAGTVWQGASGSYLFWYTWTNKYGETTVGASQVAAAVSLTSGTTTFQVTVPALPAGAAGVNVYMGLASNGLAGAQFLFSATTGGTLTPPSNFPALTTPPTANTALLPAPTFQPSINPQGGGLTGGSLAAGTYYLVYTFTNANGETTASPESLPFTVTAGAIPTVSLQQLPPGITGINIYLTHPGGASGSETFYTSIPIPPNTTANSPLGNVMAGYLQPSVQTNLETPPSQYALAAAAPSSTVTPPATNSAYLSPPAVTPVVQLPVNSPLVQSGLGNVMAGYMQPILFGDVAYMSFISGGSLQPGTYQLAYTYLTATGETTPSNWSAPFTVSAGQVPLAILVPAITQQATGPNEIPPGGMFPPGVLATNIYLTAPNGGTNTAVRYLSNVKTSIVPLSIPQGLPQPPSANTTAGHRIRTLVVNNDTLGTVDPSWGATANLVV
jgi:hypothetical protein